METKPVRAYEQDHETLQELADSHDTSMAEILTDVLEMVDVDQLQAGNGSNTVGLCPECGTEIPSENVGTGVLSGAVRAQCPAAEQDDDVHQNTFNPGKYEIGELDQYDGS